MNCGQTLITDNFYFDCTDDQNCTDTYCRGYLVGFHQISEGDFNNMVCGYFGVSLSHKPKAISINAADLIPSADDACKSQYIEFKSAETNPDDNDDVTVARVHGIIQGNYSMAYFKGIDYLFKPDLYWFSKGICPATNKGTMVMYATRDGEVVYYGDLSDVYP